jgi:branched-chain amino acid transport system substrate-binding protein
MRHVGTSVAALGLALAMLAGPQRARAAEPYNINVILSTTGVAAFLGTEEKQALEILESYANKNGGIQGRPVHFVIFDDTSNPAIAVQLANHVIADKIPVLLGPGFTATCKAVEPLMSNGPVNYCFSPAGGGPPGSFVFTASFSTPDGYKTLVRYFRLRGAKRIALLTSTDATGQDGEHGIIAASQLSENRDMTVVAQEHLNPTDISATAQMSRITAAKPDVLIAWSIGAPLTTMLRAINDTGYAGPVITSHGNMTYGQMNQLTPILPKGGLFFASPRFLSHDFMRPGPLLDAVNTFYAAFRAAGVAPDPAHTFAWDPGLVTIEALRHVGTKATAAELRDYIEKMHGFYGVVGQYDFRDGSQRGITGNDVVISRWDPSKKTWVAVSAPGGTPHQP